MFIVFISLVLNSIFDVKTARSTTSLYELEFKVKLIFNSLGL